MSRWRVLLSAATVLSSLAFSQPGRARGVYPDPVPPLPSAAQVGQASQTLGNPLDSPVTGAAELPLPSSAARPRLRWRRCSRHGLATSTGLASSRAVRTSFAKRR